MSNETAPTQNPNLITGVPSTEELARSRQQVDALDNAINFNDDSQRDAFNAMRASRGQAPIPAPSGRQPDLSGLRRPSDFISQKPVEDHTSDTERAMTHAELREILARQRAARAGQAAVSTKR